MATVDEIIVDQQQVATGFLDGATGFVNRLFDIALTTKFELPAISFEIDETWSRVVEATKSDIFRLQPGRPSLSISGINSPPLPPSFEFSEIGDISVPDLTAAAPAIDIPQAPSAALPGVPSAPSFSDPAIPDSPTIVLPVAPTFSPVAFPEPPSVQIPLFSSTLPVDDLIAPSNTFQFFEQAYQSALLDAAKAKLLDNMINGGYGIEPSDEQALYERARAREVETALVAEEEIYRSTAARGFPLPPGDLNVAVQRAQQELQNKVSGINRDITLKRADLFVENRQFTITEARGLENILINFHNSVMERALNTARAVLDASIQIFNAQVLRYNAKLDTYKTEAQVFEAKIRAALAQVEIYRTTVEAKKAELEGQSIQVDIYRAQLSGIESIVNVYRTRMEAANIQANVNRVRIEAFRGLIDAYTAQVQAKTAEFGMFEARIRGEIAKVQVFESQVRAYNAQVDSAKVRADIQVAGLQAEVEQARTKLASYQANVEQYRANIDAQIKIVSAQTDIYGTDVRAFATSIEGLAAAYRLEMAGVQANVDRQVKLLDLAINKAQVELKAQEAAASLALNATGFGTNFYASAVSSTLGSIGTLASVIEGG